MLRLNTIAVFKKAKHVKKRVGRGIGAGGGKTGGRGHKGQRSRSGCKINIGFEGGQTPLHRRLPKFGFLSCKSRSTQEVKLSNLSCISESVIDLNVLKKYNIVNRRIKFVKIILFGKINRPVTIKNLRLSQGARDAIEEAGGTIK